VETPCHSIARPNKIMAGTRITLLQKPPAGFDFTIRTPGTPPRWVEMDGEMAHVWKLLRAEAQRQPAPDLDRFTELALTFYFYWVNFGPLSRGTAACGYIAFFALMLSIGSRLARRSALAISSHLKKIVQLSAAPTYARRYEVDVSPPQGTQVRAPAPHAPAPTTTAQCGLSKGSLPPSRCCRGVLNMCVCVCVFMLG
jgi:hypothetical protein